MKQNLDFWYHTSEVFWITLVAFLANYFISLTIDFSSEFDWRIGIKCLSLIISVLMYSLYFVKFRKAYEESKHEDIKNLTAFQINPNKVARKEYPSFFIENYKAKKVKGIVFVSLSFLFVIVFMYNF